MPKDTDKTKDLSSGKPVKKEISPAMQELMTKREYLKQVSPLPKTGELVEGKVIALGKSEVYIDIGGITTGVVRGPELHDESGEFSNLKIGDDITATVIGLDNEKGEMELSFRHAGHQKAWNKLAEHLKKGKIVSVKAVDANKGGLILKLGQMTGFLPVSQLSAEHYPRIEGGDKDRILEKLKSFIGQTLKVKIITAEEGEEKLIFSEKAALLDKHGEILTHYKVGDIVKGKVSGVTDFGAFVRFGEGLEGLVHISELAWQRIDNPHDVIKKGDEVKAEIIDIDETKISLSTKRLKEDPWKNITKKYKTGQVVEGTVLKVNPFGLFVELDKDIHGLAHISELSTRLVKDPREIAKPGDKVKFKIVSLEPEDHRLGLSLKALEKETVRPKSDSPTKKSESEAVRTDTKSEEKTTKKIVKDKQDKQ